MWRRLSPWRGRDAARPVVSPPDRERLARMGEALRYSYGGEEDDRLDDRLVALMLELSVEPEEPIQVEVQAWRR
jgi:hypothetical protein